MASQHPYDLAVQPPPAQPQPHHTQLLPFDPTRPILPSHAAPASGSGVKVAESRARKKEKDEEGEEAVKRRSTKACDHCRKCKCKCARPEGQTTGPCENCIASGVECTFNGVSKKRGPPKGYIETLSDKLRRLEDVVSRLSTLPDASIVIDALREDPATAELLAPVLEKQQQAAGVASSSKAPGSSSPRQRRRLNSVVGAGAGSVQQQQRTVVVPPEISDEDPTDADLADVVGQLSLDENENLRYHGTASGLHLISQNKRHEGGIWRLPRPGVWPASHELPQMSEQDVVRVSGARDVLPERRVQENLIELYFTYVHPVFSVIHKSAFLRAFNESTSPAASPRSDADPEPVSILLLLAIFSLASRYSSVDSPQPAVFWSAGVRYVEKAKEMIYLDNPASRLSSVQAQLLLTYRSLGVGDMKAGWLFLGAAVRMAEDIGLHRDVAKYVPVGKARIGPEEMEARKRTWHCCVVLDTYVSSFIGRPTAIHYSDHDTRLASEGEIEEHEAWQPIEAHVSCTRDACSLNDPDNLFNWSVPQTSHALSCFNRFATLSTLQARILEKIYNIRGRPSGQPGEQILTYFDQALSRWFLDLPPYLKYQPTAERLPPPHILSLHCAFYCTLNLLHRPFIPPRGTAGATSAFPSHAIATFAANSITSIVTTLERRHGFLKKSPATLIYYIFTAGVMHCFNLSYPDLEIVARTNLKRTMDALRGMELVWPAAGRSHDLLAGLVDLREPDLVQHAAGPRGIKRVGDTPDDGAPYRFGTSSSAAVLPTSIPASAFAPPPQPLRQPPPRPQPQQMSASPTLGAGIPSPSAPVQFGQHQRDSSFDGGSANGRAPPASLAQMSPVGSYESARSFAYPSRPAGPSQSPLQQQPQQQQQSPPQPQQQQPQPPPNEYAIAYPLPLAATDGDGAWAPFLQNQGVAELQWTGYPAQPAAQAPQQHQAHADLNAVLFGHHPSGPHGLDGGMGGVQDGSALPGSHELLGVHRVPQ